jgi:hypothetical protein
MGNKTKKNTAAVVESKVKSNILPDPPSEIKLDLDPKTEEKENNMETPKTATKAQVITLVKEMNSILADCKIKTSGYAIEAILPQIESHVFELVYTDFAPINEGDKVFTQDSIETMILLGIAIPTAPEVKAPKNAKSKKVATDKYTWQDATEAAVRELCILGATLAELQAETIKNYNQPDVTLPGGTFGNFLTALIRFNVVTIGTDKKYTLASVLTTEESVEFQDSLASADNLEA